MVVGKHAKPGQELHERRDPLYEEDDRLLHQHADHVEVGLHGHEFARQRYVSLLYSVHYGSELTQTAVAYDTFLGSSASGAQLFEVMVWLGVYGGVSPLSANGYPFTPIATVTIGGTVFDLAYGLNGSVKVYSFVARGGLATNFSADFVSAPRRQKRNEEAR
jgi:xyloglucan-specific endo-beta-1,4-glucanase